MRRGGFTLVEVVLAILIISGIMTVLLYFYQRAAEVRQNALGEAEYLSTSRMLLEQISSELRTARVVEDQFVGLVGTSNALSFVCTSIPQMARWITSSNETVSLPPATDLKWVTYTLVGGTNLSGARGVDRKEEMLLGPVARAVTNEAEFEGEVGTDLAETNLVTELDTNFVTTNLVRSTPLPLTDKVQYLTFRYWAETNWTESWSGLTLPKGVEVTLGRDPMPADATEGYPYEFFRRVIYLPGSTHASNQLPAEVTFEFAEEAFP